MDKYLLKNNLFSICAALLSFAALQHVKEISVFLNLQEYTGWIFAISVIVFIVTVINSIASFVQQIWEYIWSKFSKPIDHLYLADEITLKISRAKLLTYLFLCLLFLATATAMLLHPSSARHVWVGWLCVLSFGLGCVIFLAQLMPRASFLRITSQGIYVQSLWRLASFDWLDIEEFGVRTLYSYDRGILMKSKEIYLRISPTSYEKVKNYRWLRSLFNRDNYHLPDNYGVQHEALVKLLTEKKKQYSSNG